MRRKLPNLRDTVEPCWLWSAKKHSFMEKYNVLSPRETESRHETYLERYVKDAAVESRLTPEIAKAAILPAAVKYQCQLATTALALKQLGGERSLCLVPVSLPLLRASETSRLISKSLRLAARSMAMRSVSRTLHAFSSRGLHPFTDGLFTKS